MMFRFDSNTDIHAPVVKAVTMVAAGVTTSAGAVLNREVINTFWPHTFQEWAAAIASVVALCYSLLLIAEWIWKKLLKPPLKRKGMLRG